MNDIEKTFKSFLILFSMEFFSDFLPLKVSIEWDEIFFKNWQGLLITSSHGKENEQEDSNSHLTNDLPRSFLL